MEKVLVLGARRFDFKDDAGARVEGTTLYYVTNQGDGGEENQVGEVPMQVTAPVAVFHQLEEVPALYDVEFKQRPGPRGRPTLQAARVSYSGEAAFAVNSDSPKA